MYTQYARHLRGFLRDVDAFKFFYDKGIRYADVLSSEFKAISLEEYSEHLNEAGMFIGSVVSLHETPSFNPATAAAARAEVRSLIDRMEKLNIDKMMVAPKVDLVLSSDDFKRLRENMLEAYADAVEYAKGAGIKIMIENQSMTTRPDSRIRDIKYLLDSIPELYFTLDTGNFFCVKEDALLAYEIFKDKTIHSHVKDWAYNTYGSFVRPDMPAFEGVAIGDGVLPNKEILARMKEYGYEGNLNLEINSKIINLERLVKSAEFLSKHS